MNPRPSRERACLSKLVIQPSFRKSGPNMLKISDISEQFKKKKIQTNLCVEVRLRWTDCHLPCCHILFPACFSCFSSYLWCLWLTTLRFSCSVDTSPSPSPLPWNDLELGDENGAQSQCAKLAPGTSQQNEEQFVCCFNRPVPLSKWKFARKASWLLW